MPSPLRLIASEAHQFPQLALTYHDNAVHARALIAGIFFQGIVSTTSALRRLGID